MKEISAETADIIVEILEDDTLLYCNGLTHKFELTSAVERRITKSILDDIYQDILLNEEFIDLFKDKINWDNFSKYQNFDNPGQDLMGKYAAQINWDIISEFQPLDTETIKRFSNKLNFKLLEDNVDADFDSDDDWYKEFLAKKLNKFNNNKSNKSNKIESNEGNSKTSKGESSKMARVVDVAKSDFKKAGYRTASKKMIEGVNAALVKIMEQKSYSNEHIALVQSFLKTEIGHTVMSAILGMALTYIPVQQLQENEHVQILAEEFRINAMEVLQTEVVDVVINNFLPVVMEALKYLPQDKSDLFAGTNSQAAALPEGNVNTKIKSKVKEKVEA